MPHCVSFCIYHPPPPAFPLRSFCRVRRIACLRTYACRTTLRFYLRCTAARYRAFALCCSTRRSLRCYAVLPRYVYVISALGAGVRCVTVERGFCSLFTLPRCTLMPLRLRCCCTLPVADSRCTLRLALYAFSPVAFLPLRCRHAHLPLGDVVRYAPALPRICYRVCRCPWFTAFATVTRTCRCPVQLPYTRSLPRSR